MFDIPEGLHPSVAPLAWLVGSWRGWGVISYPDVPDQVVIQEMEFTIDADQPWVRQRTKLWTVTPESAKTVEREMSGAEGLKLLEQGPLLSVETSYWRPIGGGIASREEALAAIEANPDADKKFEILTADPSGYVMMWVGEAKGPRIRMVTDALVRSPDAPEINAATRMFGLVNGDLMWAQDIAALGHELQSYISGGLSRI